MRVEIFKNGVKVDHGWMISDTKELARGWMVYGSLYIYDTSNGGTEYRHNVAEVGGIGTGITPIIANLNAVSNAADMGGYTIVLNDNDSGVPIKHYKQLIQEPMAHL